MTVTQYETRFMDLARHALLLLPTVREIERVIRFIDGLTHPIMLHISKETGGEISFQTAANVARWIDMVLSQERGQGFDKRLRHFSGFSGASSGGREFLESGRQGQFQGHQSQQSISCYTCGDPRHIARFCSWASGISQQQGSRAMVLTPFASPPAQPARGKGQAARGGGQAIKGRGQAVRGGGQAVRGGARDAVHSGGA
ncbi:uncharacterized protein [Nicotiana tomentosiformis]|uniref:uncharacterized protein n=1 Tax=Nicotiana tomentosiformis TaxID=4098 RepID=UPI00388CA336